MDRLDLTHTLMVKTLGDRLYLAPIEPKKMSRILDIGTGTGICMFGFPRIDGMVLIISKGQWRWAIFSRVLR